MRDVLLFHLKFQRTLIVGRFAIFPLPGLIDGDGNIRGNAAGKRLGIIDARDLTGEKQGAT